MLDGVKDGVISDPANCAFDPYKLVGSRVDCDDTEITVTYTMADIVHKILDGPTTISGDRLWYGLNVGTPFDGIALTESNSNGATIGVPFPISDS
jgi:feruloyl esterase